MYRFIQILTCRYHALGHKFSFRAQVPESIMPSPWQMPTNAKSYQTNPNDPNWQIKDGWGLLRPLVCLYLNIYILISYVILYIYIGDPPVQRFCSILLQVLAAAEENETGQWERTRQLAQRLWYHTTGRHLQILGMQWCRLGKAWQNRNGWNVIGWDKPGKQELSQCSQHHAMRLKHIGHGVSGLASSVRCWHSPEC